MNNMRMISYFDCMCDSGSFKVTQTELVVSTSRQMAQGCGRGGSTTQSGPGTFVRADSFSSTTLPPRSSPSDTAPPGTGWPSGRAFLSRTVFIENLTGMIFSPQSDCLVCQYISVKWFIIYLF